MLFDVDGTLFLTHDPLAAEALRGSLQERFDVRLPDDAMERVDYQGQTSLRIARLILEVAALDDATIERRPRRMVPALRGALRRAPRAG